MRINKITQVSFISIAIIFALFLTATANDIEKYIQNASNIKTVSFEARGQRFEPQQTIVPGVPSRHTSNYHLETQWALEQGRINENWKLNTVYPFPNALEFQAQYDKTGGKLNGRDGFRPNTTGRMTSARVGAVTKDLWLMNPFLLMANADSVETLLSRLETNNTYTFNAFDTQWRVTQDPQTGFPLELQTTEKDHLEGTLVNAVSYSDWRMVNQTPFPFRIEQTVNDKLVKREVRADITLDEKIAPISWGEDGAPKIDEEQLQRGWDMSHFFLRRAMLGGPSDGDEAAVAKIKNVEDGIYQIVGSSHHTVVIEGSDGLALVDAAWYPRRSEAVLKAIKDKWGSKKPIKYVILTHHHIDHIGGLLSFAELDTTIVTGRKTFPYINEALAKTQQMPPKMRPVDKRLTITGIGRDIELFDVPNSHANDMIAIYVPDTKTVINSDLYSPGRPTQHPVWSAEFASAVKFHALDVKNHLGTHGNGTEPHENLLALGKKAK